MKKVMVLYIDIETSPIVAYVWQKNLYNTNIGAEQIVSDMHLMSFAAKWMGDKKIIYEDQSKCKDMSNDAALLKSIWKLLDEADIVIVQNGKAFDLPTIRARMMAQGILPPSPFRIVDTYKEAKKQFSFTKNSLGFLAQISNSKTRKSKHGKFPGLELWKECLAGNPKAWKEMKDYNIDDVRVLEEIYEKMRPWIEGHPNVGVYVDFNGHSCPKCGGKVEKRGVAATNAGLYQRFHCLVCGGYSRGKTMVGSKEHRKQQLVN